MSSSQGSGFSRFSSQKRRMARPPKEWDPDEVQRTVFVGGIRDLSDQLIIRTLQKCGTVSKYNQVWGSGGDGKSSQRRAFAFVEFATREQAQKAIRDLHNTKLIPDGPPLVVDWSHALEKSSGSMHRDTVDQDGELWRGAGRHRAKGDLAVVDKIAGIERKLADLRDKYGCRVEVELPIKPKTHKKKKKKKRKKDKKSKKARSKDKHTTESGSDSDAAPQSTQYQVRRSPGHASAAESVSRRDRSPSR